MEDCDADCEDDELCVVAGEWDEAEAVAADEEGEDWSGEDDDEWCEEDAGDGDAAAKAAPVVRLSRLHATPASSARCSSASASTAAAA